MRMMTHHSPHTARTQCPLNVLYFGLTGAFSVPPLEALVKEGFAVRAVVLPALSSSSSIDDSASPYTHYVLPSPPPTAHRRRPLPLLTTNSIRTIVQIAAEHHIPLIEVSGLRHPATLATLAAYNPDVICIACFSKRIPLEILRIPRLGCLNVHPSLLPSNRGPDPLFWTFRYGEPSTGVTIHQMDEGLDSGPILLQEHIEVPEGISEAALERHCATTGGALLIRTIHALNFGSVNPVKQNEALASTNPWPVAADYTITSDHPARWAYSFACGIVSRTQPIHIITPERAFRLVAPLGYDASATLGATSVVDGDMLSLQCTPGVFRARVAAP